MRRRLGPSLVAVLVAAAVVMTGPATGPAAAQTTICSGVSVKEVQKCDPGWAANMHFMHWNMYRGHNCTNYVAYRLKRDGVPQPPYRLGNADTWAPNAKRHGVLVDNKPEVGAVGAWPGRRHVVYVEEIGPNYLITSEDNWPGYYPKGMYRKIKVFKGERAYPDPVHPLQGQEHDQRTGAHRLRHADRRIDPHREARRLVAERRDAEVPVAARRRHHRRRHEDVVHARERRRRPHHDHQRHRLEVRLRVADRVVGADREGRGRRAAEGHHPRTPTIKGAER